MPHFHEQRKLIRLDPRQRERDLVGSRVDDDDPCVARRMINAQQDAVAVEGDGRFDCNNFR